MLIPPKFLFFLHFLLSYCQNPSYPNYDIYIDYFSNCSTGCSGNRTQPYTFIVPAINHLFSIINASTPFQTPISLNIRYLSAFYVSNSKTKNNLFMNWESLLNTSIFLTIAPDSCFSGDCGDVFLYFHIKSENITFYTTKTTVFRNIIFSGIDFNLNITKYQSLPCYNSSQGCCSEASLIDPSSDCYLSSRILPRTRSSQGATSLSLIEITYNTTELDLFSCQMKYFLSQKLLAYYSSFIRGSQNQPFLNITAVNCSMGLSYFPLYAIRISVLNYTFYWLNSTVLNHNPFYFREGITDTDNAPTFFYLGSLPGYAFFYNSFVYAQNLIFFQGVGVIANCKLRIKPANQTYYLKPPFGTIKMLDFSSLVFKNNSMYCVFDKYFLNLPSYYLTLNEIAVFSVSGFSSVLVQDSNFSNMSLLDGQLFFLGSYNNLSIINSKLTNITHICNDVPSACAFTLVVLTSFNNGTVFNCSFTNITMSKDRGLFSIDSSNVFLMQNTVFSLISSNRNSISLFTTTANNNISLISSTFLGWTSDPGFVFLDFGSSEQVLFLNNTISSLDSISSQVSFLRVQSGCYLLIQGSNFRSLPVNGPLIRVLNLNTVQILGSNFFNVTITENGVLSMEGRLSIVTVTQSTFDSVMTYLKAGVFFLNDHNQAVLTSCVINNCGSETQDGGVFYLNTNNNLTLNDTQFISNMAYFGGVVSAYLQNRILVNFSYFINNSGDNNAGGFYLTTKNFLSIFGSILTQSQSSNGRAGLIMLISSNTVNFYNNTITDTLSYAEAGLLYAETNNTVVLQSNIIRNISSLSADGGCFFLKEKNVLKLMDSTLSQITCQFSGAVFSLKNQNNVTINNSNFANLSALKEGGFGVAQHNNRLYIKFSRIFNASSYQGGFLSLSTSNMLRINNFTTIEHCDADSMGGLIWAFELNDIRINTSEFNNIISTSDGGLAYLDRNNIFVIDNASINLITSLENGGLFYVDLGNLIIFTNSIVSNIAVLDYGLLVLGRSLNNFTFSGDSILNSLYCALVHLEIGNNIIMKNVSITLQKIAFNSEVFYLNSSNTFNINSSTFTMTNSTIITNFIIFESLDNNFITFNSSLFNIDKCQSFFKGDSNTSVHIQNMKFQGLKTDDSTLFWLNSGNLVLFRVLFQKNSISNTINIKNSSCSFTEIIVYPSINNSIFLSAESSSLTILKASFKSLGSKVYSQIIFGSFLSIYLEKTDFLDLKHSGTPCIAVTDSNVTIHNSLLFGNANSKTFGAVISLQQILQNGSFLVIHRSFFVRNMALQAGGCFFFSDAQINTQEALILSRVTIARNIFRLNSAFEGGVMKTSNVDYFQIYASKFSLNKANPAFQPLDNTVISKGGVFFITHSKLDSKIGIEIPVSLNFSLNKFRKNRADAGGCLFFDGFSLDSLNIFHTTFRDNKARYFGVDMASDVYRLRWDSFQKPDFTPNDRYFTAVVPSLESGFDYPTCLIRIVGIDRFNSITINTDEPLTEMVQIAQNSPTDSPNIFNMSLDQGAICFKGVFQRTELPVKVSTPYTITTLVPAQLNAPSEGILRFTLVFRDCSIGERLTEEFKCSRCTRGTYSFALDFVTFTDVCQTCQNMNMYCFGGGNYTMKPGHWRLHDAANIIYKCPNEAACIGDPRDFTDPTTEYNPIYSSENCEIGYTGALCTACQENFGALDGFVCSACKDKIYYVRVLANMLLRLVFTIYMIHVSITMSLGLGLNNPNINSIIGTNLLKIFTNHLQILGIIFSFPMQFPPQIIEVTGFLLSVSPNVSEAFSIECVLKELGLYLSLQYFKLIVAAIYPVLLVLIFLVWVHAFKKRKAPAEITKVSIFNLRNFSHFHLKTSKLAATVFALVVVTCYADISKMALAMFGCVEVGDGKTSKKLLFNDMRIDCNGSYHTHWIKSLASPVLVFFLVFYPLNIIFQMGRALRSSKDDGLFRFQYGFFYYAYKRKYFYWDFIIILRKLLLIFINAFFFLRITEVLPVYPIVMVLAIMILAFLAQVYLKPWQREAFDMINKFEELSMIISIFSIVISIFFLTFTTISNDLATILVLVLIILNALFFLFWVRDYYRHFMKHRLKDVFNSLKKNAKGVEISNQSSIKKPTFNCEDSRKDKLVVKKKIANVSKKTVVPSGVNGVKDSVEILKKKEMDHQEAVAHGVHQEFSQKLLKVEENLTASAKFLNGNSSVGP